MNKIRQSPGTSRRLSGSEGSWIISAAPASISFLAETGPEHVGRYPHSLGLFHSGVVAWVLCDRPCCNCFDTDAACDFLILPAASVDSDIESPFLIHPFS